MSSCLNMHLDKLCDLFICQLKTRGNKEVSIESYRCCCKLFQDFAKSVEEQTVMQSYKSKGFDKGREQQQLAKLGSFTQENFRTENLTI